MSDQCKTRCSATMSRIEMLMQPRALIASLDFVYEKEIQGKGSVEHKIGQKDNLP